MSSGKSEAIWELMGVLFQSHPWHGVSPGPEAPEIVSAYIEITPTDTVKYEIDKTTGHLKIDRPQKFSNVTPSLYGFIPQTYCGEKVAELAETRTARQGIVGDGDPLDICVLSERAINHGAIFLKAVPIGGLRMLDKNEADDKIVAVMEGDAAYGKWRDIEDCPAALIDRLRHYFLTYKLVPGAAENVCEITHVYGREEAHDVIRRSRDDYHLRFGGLESLLNAALRG
jgi:inorganic pyrophosphatase